MGALRRILPLSLAVACGGAAGAPAVRPLAAMHAAPSASPRPVASVAPTTSSSSSTTPAAPSPPAAAGREWKRAGGDVHLLTDVVWLDARRLVVVDSPTLAVVDVVAGTTRVLRTNAGPRVVASPDGRLIACIVFDSPLALELLATADGRTVRRIEGATPVYFSPRGRRLAYRDDTAGEMRVLDLVAGTTTAVPELSGDAVGAALARARRVVLPSDWTDGGLVWDADLDLPLGVLPRAQVGDGGAWLVDLGAMRAYRAGGSPAGVALPTGGFDVAVDPEKPVAYVALDYGYYAVVDLEHGTQATRGTRPPPRTEDCCGSPALVAPGVDLVLSHGGFGLGQLLDARTATPVFPDTSTATDFARAPSGFVAGTFGRFGGIAEARLLDRAHRVVWAHWIDVVAPGGPYVAMDPSGARLAVWYAGSPHVLDATTGRTVYPGTRVETVRFESEDVLVTVDAADRGARWDLRARTFQDIPAGAARAIPSRLPADDKRCEMAPGAVSPAGTRRACIRGESVVLPSDNGSERELWPRADLHAAYAVSADGDSVDLLGDEDAARSLLRCDAGDHDAPFTTCEARVRGRGLFDDPLP